MNIPQDDLDALARLAEGIRSGGLEVVSLILRGKYEQARDKATELHIDGAQILTKLHEAGAMLPSSLPQSDGVPLDLLSTPANRRLAAALREAHEAAREVDQERGYSEHVREQAVEDLLAVVEMEVRGPLGFDR
jgi:hypothetical protein